MKRDLIIFAFLSVVVFVAAPAAAQVGVFSKEFLIQYTPMWKGERFPDGRPKVSDDILRRMKDVSIEEGWAVCRQHGFNNQFEGNWVTTHQDPVLVGRALTAYFLPARPDVNQAIEEQGKKDGRIGGQNSWVIDTVVKGDVIVVDLMGKVIDGTFMGDNLANSIWAKSGGTGVVIDGGGTRHRRSPAQSPTSPCSTAAGTLRPSPTCMLVGLNTPIRVGRAAVMPGDVVLGKREGILFVPAHLAQEVVETSEIIRLRDQFGHQRLREGKYTPGQIDRQWSEDIEKDFTEWLKTRSQELTPYQREKLLKEKTS